MESIMQKTIDKKVSASLASFIYKTATMGGESITDIMSKAKEGDRPGELEKLRSELSRQFSEYENIAAEAEQYLSTLNIEAKEENMLTKISAKAGIMMNTMKDASPSHISEMMIQGLAMGITEMTSKVRESKEQACDDKMIALGDRLVSFQEDAVDRMKKFL